MPPISSHAARFQLAPAERDRRVHALLDQDGSGKLNRDEWLASGRSASEFRRAAGHDDGALSAEAFHALRDRERAAEAARGERGGWTLEEFRAAETPPGLLRAERGMPIQKRHLQAFAARDRDRDGRLSEEELARPDAPSQSWFGGWRRLLP
ncbi:MAG: hypothetical protein VKP62_01270 [Candidatus Sericytochromatia bacterium]|nr:hypothetical protein [Candidatus Sericytochromatia bacterium]